MQKQFEVYELINGVECVEPDIIEGTEEYVVNDLCITYGIETKDKSINEMIKELNKEGVRIIEIEK